MKELLTRNKQAQKRQSGRSMIEMLGVLAIIGVLSVGGLVGYNKAMFKYKINKSIDEIVTIIANVKGNFINEKDFTKLDKDNKLNTELAKGMGIFPNYMWQNDDTLKNPFGGKVELSGFHVNFAYVYYRELPYEACITLATLNWGQYGTDIFAVGAGNVDTNMLSDCLEDPDSDEEYSQNGETYKCLVNGPMSLEVAQQGCLYCQNSITCGVALAFK